MSRHLKGFASISEAFSTTRQALDSLKSDGKLLGDLWFFAYTNKLFICTELSGKYMMALLSLSAIARSLHWKVDSSVHVTLSLHHLAWHVPASWRGTSMPVFIFITTSSSDSAKQGRVREAERGTHICCTLAHSDLYACLILVPQNFNDQVLSQLPCLSHELRSCRKKLFRVMYTWVNYGCSCPPSHKMSCIATHLLQCLSHRWFFLLVW